MPSRSRLRRALVWLCAGDRGLAVAMGLLCLYYVVDKGIFEGKGSGDGLFGYQYLRAIVHEHTLDMKAVIPHFMPYFGVGGPGMHMPNRCPFGPVYVWMPFYLAGSALQALLEHFKLTPPGNGQTPLQLWVTALGTLAAVLVGWRYLYVLLERHLGGRAALVGAVAAVWATPIVWYTATQPLYQHGLAFATIAILVERWDAWRGTAEWRRFAWLGFIGGLAISMRVQEGIYLLLPGVEAALGVVRGAERRRWLVSGVVLSACCVLTLVPQMLVWRYYTGSLFHAPQVEPMRWGTPAPIAALFSTRAGLFPWTPVAYASLLGLVFVRARRARTLTLSLAAVFALEVWVVCCAWNVTGGYTYGARRLSDGAVLLGLGVALLFAELSARDGRWARRGRVALTAFVGLCVALNLVAMEGVRNGLMASSGAYPRSAARFLRALHAPEPLARFFERVGYPFVQPAGWLFALRWHLPLNAFENVVGNRLLERDEHWFQLQWHLLPFDSRDWYSYIGSGLQIDEHGPAHVTGPVRLILPFFGKEPFTVELVGSFGAGATSVRWNGQPLPLRKHGANLQLAVPVEVARAGINEIELTLPVGSTLVKMEFQPTSAARPR